MARGKVWLIAKRLGHLENLGPGHRVDARAIMQSPIHRSDRHSQRPGDLLDAGWARLLALIAGGVHLNRIVLGQVGPSVRVPYRSLKRPLACDTRAYIEEYR